MFPLFLVALDLFSPDAGDDLVLSFLVRNSAGWSRRMQRIICCKQSCNFNNNWKRFMNKVAVGIMGPWSVKIAHLRSNPWRRHIWRTQHMWLTFSIGIIAIAHKIVRPNPLLVTMFIHTPSKLGVLKWKQSATRTSIVNLPNSLHMGVPRKKTEKGVTVKFCL